VAQSSSSWSIAAVTGIIEDDIVDNVAVRCPNNTPMCVLRGENQRFRARRRR
jgi:hypothetical protein